jgi:carboxypeptidase Q
MHRRAWRTYGLASTAAIAAIGGLVAAASAPNSPAIPAEVRATAQALREKAFAGTRAARWVRELTDFCGPRLTGSDGYRRAVEWSLATMKAQGLSNVHAEPVTAPVWVRGEETGEIVSPVRQKLSLAALGGSVATPANGLEAEVVEMASLEALAENPAAARGKIVFFDKKMERHADGSGYGRAVDVRTRGPARAGAAGALGVLIRSIGTDSERLPHTGTTDYDAGGPRIPAAALSIPDAELLERLLRDGRPVRVRFLLTCHDGPPVQAANVVGEIPGRTRPSEVVLLGGHLDSWDLGTGAIDDGAGVAIVFEAARLITGLPRRPERTVRVVFFANEENGLAGGKAYAAAHETELPRHAAALESDSGTGRPLGFSWNAGPSAEPVIRAIGELLEPLGAGELHGDGGGGADISPLRSAGVPLFSVRQDASRYFDYHHTANDTFDKIEPESLDRNVAAVAAFAWVAASLPHELERIPPEKRTSARRR